MPGSTLDWKTLKTAQNAGQLWRGLAIPAAAGRLTLHTDGTPESVANPNAKHLGATKAGAKLMVKSTLQNFNVDEFMAPIVTGLDAVAAAITCELVGVTDTELMEALLPGVGTRVTGSGYEQVTIGRKAIEYDSIALIFPLIEDITKFGVFHLYKALNDAGVEFPVGRKELGFTPANFVAYEIPTRAAGDTLCSFWKQVA